MNASRNGYAASLKNPQYQPKIVAAKKGKKSPYKRKNRHGNKITSDANP